MADNSSKAAVQQSLTDTKKGNDALNRVFGNNLPNIDDIEKANALALLKSPKGWSDDDVHELATNPPGRLQRNVESSPENGSQ